MDKYGWYTEGDEELGGSGDDVAELIQDAVADFAAGETEGTEEARSNIADFLGKLRVGDMRDFCVDDLINADDISDFGCDESTPMGDVMLWELLDVRMSALVFDGQAIVIADSDPFPTANEAGKADAPAVLEWARNNITFDPPHYCNGRSPFPFCLVDGKWIFGDKETENADIKAYVVYTTQPSPETGHEGWVWLALGRMGESATLKDAMAQAEAKLAQITAAEQANGN